MTAPGTLRAAYHRAAVDLADEAARAAGAAEAAYRAIAPARAALSAAERAHAEAVEYRDAAKHGPAQLARALGWLRVNVAAEPATDYSGPTTNYRAAFAGGRVTQGPKKYHGTPIGRAYGWILRADLSRGSEPGETYSYEPAAGTNNPEKLAAQVHDATINLRAWLSGFTAEAWLRAHGLDPDHAPDLRTVVAYTAGAERVPSSGGPWHRPVWTMTLGGATIARIDDRREIFEHVGSMLADEHPGNGGRRTDQPQLSEDEDRAVVEAYAVDHAPRAAAALLRRFTYQPDADR